MNIDLGPMAHALEKRIKQILDSLFMSAPISNYPSDSCGQFSTPEPARCLTISACKNGWLVGDVDYAQGARNAPFVYTKPREVAGAVLGLITQGVPLPGVGIPNEKPANVAQAYNEGREDQRKDCQLTVDQVCATNDRLDARIVILNKDLDNLRAHRDSLISGSNNWEVLARKRLEDYLNLQKRVNCLEVQIAPVPAEEELKRQNAQLRRVHDLTLACNAAHLAMIKTLKADVNAALTRNVGAYDEGYEKGRRAGHNENVGLYPGLEINPQAKLIAQHEETHRKFQSEIDRLNGVIKSLNASMGRILGENERAAHTIDYWRTLAERRAAELVLTEKRLKVALAEE